MSFKGSLMSRSCFFVSFGCSSPSLGCRFDIVSVLLGCRVDAALIEVVRFLEPPGTVLEVSKKRLGVTVD